MFRWIPVIDLAGGRVVHGVAGERERYQPVQSVLCDDASPRAVASAFAGKLGLNTVYVADLDAIAGGEPSWHCYQCIAEAGLDLWIDCGLRTAEQARRTAEFRAAGKPLVGIIAALETIADVNALENIVREAGTDRAIFSLDLKHGHPLTCTDDWPDDPLEIARLAYETGVRRMIVLDVSRVGTGGGPGQLTLCRQMRAAWPDIELISGGGIRTLDDAQQFSEAGCNAVLVATALHKGAITPKRS